MTNLNATSDWGAVPQIEVTTPLRGGPGGALNGQAQALLNRTERLKKERRKTVLDFDAPTNGVANATAAFNAARAATGGLYHIPNGTYVLDAVPDVFADGFTAGEDVTLVIGGAPFNVSNAFSGGLRWVRTSYAKVDLIDAKTGNTVMYLQNGAPGTATGFYRGLAFTTDSHFLQAQPATLNGATDMLFQRSTANSDPGGNRAAITYEELTDRLIWGYATTASGSPAMDSAMIVYGGISARLLFPGLRPEFQQGWTVQTRAGGALKLSMVPGATAHTLKDETSGNVLETVTRAARTLAGITFNTLLDPTPPVSGPQRWGEIFGDLNNASALPASRNLFDKSTATRAVMIGTLRVAAQPSGGTGGVRESRIVFDGTALTLTDLVNTLPAGVTATVALAGSVIQFQAAYTGALGGGITVSASVEWSHAGR